jgi:cytoskeletal protein RodZ
MVREYARVVGLDQEEWVGRYLSAHQSTKNIDEDGWIRFAENASKARIDSGLRSRPDQRLRWTGIGLLLLLVAGLSWFVWSYVHKKISMGTPPHQTRSIAAVPIDGRSSTHYLTTPAAKRFCLSDPPLIRS